MGILAERQFLNNVVYAADQVDSLSDDVLAVLTRDTTWGGLALRTRILDSFLSPEINEPLAAVVRNLEIDYVELPGFAPVAVIPQGAVNINGQAFLAINPSDPARKQILDSLFNLFLGIQDIAWVESPNNWPVPNEQIPAVHTPGIFFSDSGETFEYRGSLDTLKIISLQTVLLALEPDPAQFEASKEAWVSALKLQLGDVADLRNLVNTVDILDIRTNQSKYPLIHLDVDLKVRYVQSFLAS